jgi:hypothetical protein
MKIIVALAFVAILAALASAGVFMMRDGRAGKPKTANMMRALAVRVALSVLLLVCILGAYWLGWIAPTGVPLGR